MPLRPYQQSALDAAQSGVFSPTGLGREVKPEKHFKAEHLLFAGEPFVFSESTAPLWLTSANTVPGSTMDNRWFWHDRVLTLAVGESACSNFHRITRTA